MNERLGAPGRKVVGAAGLKSARDRTLFAVWRYSIRPTRFAVTRNGIDLGAAAAVACLLAPNVLYAGARWHAADVDTAVGGASGRGKALAADGGGSWKDGRSGRGCYF